MNLFYHLVGAQMDRGQHGDAERLGGLDGCSSEDYSRIGLGVQCIILLGAYAIWR
jgi:hypothetical protein